MAASIRVGNELGAGNPSGAKKVSFVAIGCIREYIYTCLYTKRCYSIFAIAVCLCVPYTVVFLATKDYIGILFVPGNE